MFTYVRNTPKLTTMIRSFFIALTVVLCSTQVAQAQQFQLGVFGGVAHYNGDLTTNRLSNEINESLGLFGRYSFNNHFALRGGFTYGRLSGDDANQVSPDLIERNLSFRSNVFEFSLVSEINLLGLDYNKPVSPYFFGGVALFHHNPQAEINGTWVDLQPLSTEGQGLAAYPDREVYNLWQVSVPFGAGLKIRFSDAITMGMEIGWRLTFTDYLDDVSSTYVDRNLLASEKGQLAVRLMDRSVELSSDPTAVKREGAIRGNPEVNDYYLFMGTSLAFTLGNGNRRDKNQYSCPGKF